MVSKQLAALKKEVIDEVNMAPITGASKRKKKDVKKNVKKVKRKDSLIAPPK